MDDNDRESQAPQGKEPQGQASDGPAQQEQSDAGAAARADAATDADAAASAEVTAGAEATLEEQLEEAARERDQFRAMAQRAQADLVNYRRRVDEERQLLAQNATSQLILRLLPILDDFQLAVDHLPADAPASWSDGVRMILRKLQGIIDGEGVTAFSPEPGASFDPLQHEAVYFEPSDQHPAGAVISTMRPGYRNMDRVLRPAQVILAQAQESAAPEENAP